MPDKCAVSSAFCLLLNQANPCNPLNCSEFALFLPISAVFTGDSSSGSIPAVSTIFEERNSLVSKGVALFRGLPFFCVDRFQHAILEQRFGQNRLQLRIFLLQLFEPSGIGQIHVTVFLTPAMERGFRDIGMG